MDAMRPTYPLPVLSLIFAVSLSGYYAWRTRPPSHHRREDARLAVEIKAAHRRTRESYGAVRLQEELVDHGVQVGVCRVKRLRRELGIGCRQKRKFKATTDSNHSLPVAENLLAQNFVADAPGRVWLTDITYIPTDEGWLYLAGHKDICTGEIVGYAMSNRMTKNLVSQSLSAQGGGRQTALCWPYSSLGPWQPILLKGVPEAFTRVQDAVLHESQR